MLLPTAQPSLLAHATDSFVRFTRIFLILCSLCFLPCASYSQSITVPNNSFENPSQNGGYTSSPTGASWTFTSVSGSSTGISGNGNAITSGNPYAPDPFQVAWISGTASISQSLSGFTAGSTYTITISAAQRGNYNPAPQQFNITVDGTVIGSFSPAAGATSYSDYSASFTAASNGNHVIGFVGTGPNSSTILLDNVRVSVQTSSITTSNFGFENPTQSTGGYTRNPSEASWTFVSGSGSSAGISDNMSDVTNGNPNTQEGHQVAWISGTSSISQSLSGFNAGLTYVITVSAAARGNYHPSAQSFNITVDGAVIGSYTPPVSFTSYQDYTASYSCPSSGSHTVGFIGTGANNSTVLLDNVRITLVPASMIAGDNMGFELPSLSGGYTTAPTGASWAFGGSAGITGNGNAVTNGNPNSPEGVQSAWISGTGTITQSLSGFTQGVTYAITVSAAERGNYNPTAQSFNITVDGNSIGSFAPSIVSTSYLDYTAIFVASSAGSHTIGFTGTGASTSTILLDNVRITVQPASISGSNMGFELPSLSGGYTPNPTGASWTFAAGNGSAGITGNNNAITNGNPDAPEPVQVAWISGTGSITQLLSGFVPGVTYSITVSAAERQNYNPSAQSFSITVDGAAIKNIAPTTSDITYTEYTGTFVGGASGTHTIGFVGTGASNSTILIDNVRIKAIVTGPDFGFELPGLSGSYQTSPPGTPWTFSGSAGITGNGNAITSGNPNAPEGVQSAWISGTGSISQRVYGFASGTTYSITVSAAERQNYNPTAQSFNMLVDGVVVRSYSPPLSAISYSDYSITYRATSGSSHTIAFAGTGASNSTILIDNVRIAPAISSTVITDKPEPGWASGIVPSSEGASGSGAGPSSSMAVTLPSAVEENDPGADIWSYNPYGPSVSFNRLYRSALVSSSYATNYASPGLSPGWVHNYDITIDSDGTSNWNPLTLKYPNRCAETLSPVLLGGTPTGAFSHTPGVPYIVTGIPLTNGQWTSITITNPDRSQYVFMPNTNASPANANHYVLTKIINIVHHYVKFSYDSGNRLTEIDNDAVNPAKLLLLAYDTGNLLHTVTDYDGTSTAQRQVTYTFDSNNNLHQVTNLADLVVPTSSIIRWQYEYQQINGYWYLNTVESPNPSPTGPTYVSGNVVYDPSTASVVKHINAGGAEQRFDYTGASLGNIGVSYYQQNASIPDLTSTQNFDTVTANRNTGFIDAAQNIESHAYSNTNNPFSVTQTTDRDGKQYNYTYDADGHLYNHISTKTDPRGDVTTLTYEYPSDFLLGQLHQIQVKHTTNGSIDATLEPVTYSYFGAGSSFNGMVQNVISPLPGTTNASPNTVQTTYVYDPTLVNGSPLGNVQSVTVPAPTSNATSTVTITYGYAATPSMGEPTSVTDPNSHITHFAYDSRGNRISVIDASNYETDYYYNAADQIQAVAYPPTVSGSSNRAVLYYTYQYVGGPVQYVSLYSEGQLTIPTPGTVFPAPSILISPFRKSTYTYGYEGELLSKSDLVGTIASYTYDSLYRTRTITDGLGNTSGYVYDNIVGNLVQEQYPGAYSSYYGVQAPDGTSDTRTYHYDPDQILMSEVDGRGLTKTYTRNDPENLVTQISYSNVPSSVTSISPVNFSYDLFGRQIGMSDGTGSIYVGTDSNGTNGYDDLGNILVTTRSFTNGPQSQKLSYAYNADGSTATMTLPSTGVSNPLTTNSGQFTYTYNNGGLLKYIDLPWLPSPKGQYHTRTADRLVYNYQPNNWLNSSNSSMFYVSSVFNGRGFLTNYTNTSEDGTGYTTPSTFNNFVYDAAGNRTNESLADTANTTHALDWAYTKAYVYDFRDRLIQETCAPISGHTNAPTAPVTYNQYFTYDQSDNMRGFKDALSPYYDFGVNVNNQLNSPSGFNYDGNGSMITETSGGLYSGNTLKYDPEDRLTGVGTSFTGSYDGAGSRAVKTAPGTGTIYFLYDLSGAPVVEETWNGTIATIANVNAFGADGWRVRYAPGNTSRTYYAYDPQGSVLHRTVDSNSSIAGSDTQPFTDICIYDGYGQQRSEQWTGQNVDVQFTANDPVGFEGQYGYYGDWEFTQTNDNTTTKLYLHQQPYLLTHRYYDPSIGRFINRDPIGYKGGINQYAYCGGNPIMGKDPSGFRPLNMYDYLRFAKLRALAKSGNKDFATPKVSELIEGAIKSLTNEITSPSNVSDPVRLKALWWAIGHLGDTNYGVEGTLTSSSGFPGNTGENKCNIFAADAYGIKVGYGGQNGIPLYGKWWERHPASANMLGDIKSDVPHFIITWPPKAGEIAAFENVNLNYSGHTTLYIGNNVYIYAGSNNVKLGTYFDMQVGSAHHMPVYRDYSR